jgi:hypothetical protein
MTNDEDELSAVDIDALERALARVRASKDPSRREQIARMLREDWYKGAHFAAYSCQIDALKLKPWRDPPCYGHLKTDAGAYSDPAAHELADRLEAAGLSIFGPDPIAALARIEAHAHGESPSAA